MIRCIASLPPSCNPKRMPSRLTDDESMGSPFLQPKMEEWNRWEEREERFVLLFFFCGVGGFMFYVNCLLTWFILYQAEIGNKLTCRILHIEAETSSSMNLKQHRQTQKLENIGGQRNIMIVIYNHRVFSNICMHTYTFVSCESWKGSLVIQTFHTSAEFPGPEGWRIKRFIAPLAFGMFLGWMMRWV